ncbi:hypothetical protein EDD15DRAFT_2373720 [Pisolithus albus]|nr:hypothetical protein EDD15DRAFT_2373720 [Pisolithus albus]
MVDELIFHRVLHASYARRGLSQRPASPATSPLASKSLSTPRLLETPLEPSKPPTSALEHHPMTRRTPPEPSLHLFEPSSTCSKLHAPSNPRNTSFLIVRASPCLHHAIGKSNATLPLEISPRFQDVFIPTLLAYCGTVPNPWLILLQETFSALWPVVFPQARQHIYDWRSKFAETADKVVAAWFDSDEFSDSESCAAWAEWAVDATLGFPFIFKYLKSNNKGVGAFRAPLILQTLASHYTKTISAVRCPQVDSYPYGALTLSTVGVERAISMYTESGRCTEQSKAAAGNFSGDLHGKWGLSSASYARSIEGLSNRSWEEAGDVKEDARACIVDCDSDEDTSISSGDAESEPMAQSQPRPWDQWAGNDDVLSAESQPIAYSQPRPWDQWAMNDDVLSTAAVHTPTVLLLQQMTPNLNLLATWITRHHLSTLLPGKRLASLHCYPLPPQASQHLSLQSRGPRNGCAHADTDALTQSSGLYYGEKFLTGPLGTNSVENDKDY